jgi:hypothetical protein
MLIPPSHSKDPERGEGEYSISRERPPTGGGGFGKPSDLAITPMRICKQNGQI